MNFGDKDKSKELLFLYSLTILCSIFCVALNFSFLLSTIFFFGLPSLFLFFRSNQKSIKKAFIFALLAIIPLIFIEIFGIANESWFVPYSVFRFFGVIPLEDVVLGFLLSFLIILFYEHFSDQGENFLAIKKRFIFTTIFFSLVSTLSISFFYLSPSFLRIPYYYFYAGLVIIVLPVILFSLFYPKLTKRFLKVGIYFFILLLAFEIIGLGLNYWYFPGLEFIGLITIIGYRLPIEEFIFWIVFFSLTILSCYEFVYDDTK